VPPLRSQLRFLELAAEAARPPVVPEPVPVPEPRVAKRSRREQSRRSAG
jgi:hypothetical protein